MQEDCPLSSVALSPPLELFLDSLYGVPSMRAGRRAGNSRCCLSLNIMSSISTIGATISRLFVGYTRFLVLEQQH